MHKTNRVHYCLHLLVEKCRHHALILFHCPCNVVQIFLNLHYLCYSLLPVFWFNGLFVQHSSECHSFLQMQCSYFHWIVPLVILSMRACVWYTPIRFLKKAASFPLWLIIYNNVSNILKTGVHIFLDFNVLRRNLVQLLFLDKMSFLYFCWICSLSWAIDSLYWGVGLLFFYLDVTQCLISTSELIFCSRSMTLLSHISLYFAFFSVSLFYFFSNFHSKYVESFYCTICASTSYILSLYFCAILWVVSLALYLTFFSITIEYLISISTCLSLESLWSSFIK